MAQVTLTQAQAQASPRFWVFDTRGTKTVAHRQVGTGRVHFLGSSLTEALAQVNAYESERSNRNLPTK